MALASILILEVFHKIIYARMPLIIRIDVKNALNSRIHSACGKECVSDKAEGMTGYVQNLNRYD